MLGDMEQQSVELFQLGLRGRGIEQGRQRLLQLAVWPMEELHLAAIFQRIEIPQDLCQVHRGGRGHRSFDLTAGGASRWRRRGFGAGELRESGESHSAEPCGEKRKTPRHAPRKEIVATVHVGPPHPDHPPAPREGRAHDRWSTGAPEVK